MAGKMHGRRENFGRGSEQGRGGNMHKPSPNSKETKSSPKKIKIEQLQRAGYLVSPESKQSKFPIKKVLEILKAQDNTHFQEHELREMLSSWRKFKRKRIHDIQSMTYEMIVEELQQAQKQLLLQDNCDFAYDEVAAILRNKSIQHLNESMEIEQLREMLNVWNQQHQNDNSNIKQLKNAEIVACLTEAKESLLEKNFTEKSESMIEELDRETDHIFETVEKMQIDGKTTNEQILDFNDEELAYFQYVKSLREDEHLSLDDLKELQRSKLVEYCKKWRDTEYKKQNVSVVEMLMNSDNEDELYDQPNSNDGSTTNSTKGAEIELNNTDPMDGDPKPTNLKSFSTLEQINKLNYDQKREWIHQKLETMEKPVHMSTIELWPDTQIDKSIQKVFKDNQPKIIKSNLKKSKYSNPASSVQTDLQQNVMRPWRYSLFMTNPPNNKGILGLTDYLSDIFHEMGNFCPGIQLLPWDDDLFENGIDDCEDIPKIINQLKKYFKGIRSPTGVTKQYLRIRLGFPIHSDRPTFESDITGWCNAREIRMFECALQHPDSKIIGWLAYMPNTIDRSKWCISVNEVYQHVNKNKKKEDIKLGLVWKALNGQWDVPQKQKVYSMHVEVASEQAVRAKKFLRMASQMKKFPLGVRFRLMDEYHQYMKESTKIKYNYLFDKHKTLSKEMRQVESTAILNLDGKIGNTGKTLRDIITNIRDVKDNRRVFNTIDRKYNNPQAYVAQYRPDKAELAKAYIYSLATYVKHIYPGQVLKKIFTVDALEESKVESYFPNTQTFITQEDIDLDAVIQDDLDDDSFDYLNVDKINPFDIELPDQLKGGDKLYNLSGDDDTASTNPANSSTISFSNASVHLYDTRSLVSEISSLSEQKKQNKISAKSIKSTKDSTMDAAKIA